MMKTKENTKEIILAARRYKGYWKMLILSLHALIFLIQQSHQMDNSSSVLSADGVNVCSREYVFHEPKMQVFYVQRAENIIGSCCNVGKNGKCLDKDRYCSRTRVYTISVSKLRLKKRYKTKYYCCKGFQQVEDSCVKYPNYQMGVTKKKFYILLMVAAIIGIATLIVLYLYKYKQCRHVTLKCRRSAGGTIVIKDKALNKLPAADMMTHTTVAIGADRMSS